jgi:transposase
MPKYNHPRKTWVYSNEFKVRAVKLTHQADIKLKQIAEGLGIHPMMLSRWRKEYRDGLLHSDGRQRIGMSKKKKSPTKQITEVARLKKEVARLQQENDLLKKWQQYLAEQHQKDLDSSSDTGKNSV